MTIAILLSEDIIIYDLLYLRHILFENDLVEIYLTKKQGGNKNEKS